MWIKQEHSFNLGCKAVQAAVIGSEIITRPVSTYEYTEMIVYCTYQDCLGAVKNILGEVVLGTF